MARPRKKVTIPPWFDLEKYRGAADLEPVRWFEQLATRALLRKKGLCWRGGEPCWEEREPCLGDACPHGSQCITRPDVREQVWQKVREQGIVDVLADDDLGHAVPMAAALRERIPGCLILARGLRLTTLEELLDAWEQLPPDRKDLPRLDSKLEDPVDCHLPAYTDIGERHLTIDLNFSSEILVNQLQELLPKLRAKAVPAPRVNCDGWAKDGLLPFLDLEFWAGEAGITLPWRVYREKLEVSSEDQVRQTTAPTAQRVMSDRFLRGFASQLSNQG